VLSQFALLIDNTIEHAGTSFAECMQRVTNCRAWFLDFDFRFSIDVETLLFRQLDGYHELATAVLTQTTGGSESAISLHVAPSSREL
jgi:hypothetical protein